MPPTFESPFARPRGVPRLRGGGGGTTVAALVAGARSGAPAEVEYGVVALAAAASADAGAADEAIAAGAAPTLLRLAAAPEVRRRGGAAHVRSAKRLRARERAARRPPPSRVTCAEACPPLRRDVLYSQHPPLRATGAEAAARGMLRAAPPAAIWLLGARGLLPAPPSAACCAPDSPLGPPCCRLPWDPAATPARRRR